MAPNLLTILKSYDALEKVIKEATGDVDKSYPIPNMAGKSVYFSRPPKEGEPMPLKAFKGTFRREYIEDGQVKEYRGKNNTIPFSEPVTPVNGYYYYICGLRSNPDINFSVKVPAKWVAPMHGAGTNWAESNFSIFDRKLSDFAKWQFGAKDPYIIKKVPLEIAQENNFKWLDKPLPDSSGYIFSKDLADIESRDLPKHQKVIATIENRGKGTTELIRKEPRRKSEVIVTRGVTSQKDFYRMPDGTKVYKDGRREDKYGNLIKGPTKEIKQSTINKDKPKDFKGKLRQYGEMRRFDDINHLMRFIANEIESTKNRAYLAQDIEHGYSYRTKDGLVKSKGPMFEKDITKPGIEVGMNYHGEKAVDATAMRLKAKYSNIIIAMTKKARENYIAKHGQDEGLDYLTSEVGQKAIQKYVANKLAVKIANSDEIIS